MSQGFKMLLSSITLIGLGALAAYLLRLRINTSNSVPVGLWIERPFHGPLERGSVVAICPRSAPIFQLAHARGYVPQGWCASRLEVLFKPVAALEGDVVIVSGGGVTVNGAPLNNSGALRVDGAGRPLPRIADGTYRVPRGSFWAVSSFNSRSFDSRYFGALDISQVRGTLRPVWVFQ